MAFVQALAAAFTFIVVVEKLESLGKKDLKAKLLDNATVIISICLLAFLFS